MHNIIVKSSTIREAVDAFKSFLENRMGVPTDDFAYPSKLIYYLVRNVRNALVYDDIKKKTTFGEDQSLLTTLPCVLVKEVDVIECPCAPPKGCTFYKTVVPIPKMIGGLPISVTSLDGIISYDYVIWSQFKEKTSSRVMAQNLEPKYTIRTIKNKTYIYVFSSDKIEDPRRVTITAYPKDPLDFLMYPVCDENPEILCNPLDEELMVEAELEDAIFQGVARSLGIAKSLSPGVDIVNNDNNDAQNIVQRSRR